jgi:Serpentine type 7TM GPCR chemoreceptor Str
VLVILATDEVTVISLLILAAAVLSLLLCIGLVLAVLIFKNLREHSEHFSQRTYAMHRQLSVLLVMQVFGPAFFVVLPVGVIVATLLSSAISLSGDIYGDIALTLISFYTINNSLMTILFVAPYRRYSRELVGTVFCLKGGGRLAKTSGSDGGGPTAASAVMNTPAIRHASTPMQHRVGSSLRSARVGGPGLELRHGRSSDPQPRCHPFSAEARSSPALFRPLAAIRH